MRVRTDAETSIFRRLIAAAGLAFQVPNSPLFAGHCVHVVGFHGNKGYLQLDVIHDAVQGNQNAQHEVGPKTKGHLTLTLGTDANNNLRITDYLNGTPALVTNVIAEGPM